MNSRKTVITIASSRGRFPFPRPLTQSMLYKARSASASVSPEIKSSALNIIYKGAPDFDDSTVKIEPATKTHPHWGVAVLMCLPQQR